MTQLYQKRDWLLDILAFTAMITGLCYLLWLFYHINSSVLFFSLPFLFFEILNYFYAVNSIIDNKKGRFHTVSKKISNDFYPEVDVFITSCGEPFHIIKKTLLAALQIDYKKKKIYVLDDFGDEKLEHLCKQNSVFYFHRKTNSNFKAGNLNYGLQKSDADFILTLDADQVPKPSIIKKLIPYFEESKIGFVASAQNFHLPKGDPWGNADLFFYQVMQPSKSQDIASISCGSGVIYRRKALLSIGGFKNKSIIEDLYTSLHLHAKHWESIYLKTSLAIGTAPKDIATHKKQRFQWALDSSIIFFFENPLFTKGLNILQRLHYFQFGFHYVIFGLSLPFIFLVPAISIFSGYSVIRVSWLSYLLFRTPYFLFLYSFNKRVGRNFYSNKAFQMQGGLFFVFFQALFRTVFIRSKDFKYIVTKKTKERLYFWGYLKELFPVIILVLIEIAAVIYALVKPHHDFWFNVINIFWSLWVIYTMSRILYVSFRFRS